MNNCKNCGNRIFNSVLGEYKCYIKQRTCTNGEISTGCSDWSEKRAIKTEIKEVRKDGATFTPSVSEGGVLSWTNDQNLDNPKPVNIKGPAGERGPQGEKGEPGEKGKDGVIGADGKSAYEYAKEAGYEGTEEEFAEKLASDKAGVTSWNDLEDKPFGSEFEYEERASATGVVKSYDADTLMASFQASLDFVPVPQKTYKLIATDGVQTIETVATSFVMDLPSINMYTALIGSYEDSLTIGQNSKGTLWEVRITATTEVGAEWTITVYEYTEIITSLDGKYLPDGIPFVASASVGQGIAIKAVAGDKPTEFEAVNLVKSYNDLTDVPLGETSTMLMHEQTVYYGGMFAASLGTHELYGCNIVSFDGEKYQVQEYDNGVTRYYGNRYLENHSNPDNGLPFLIRNDIGTNSVSLRAKTFDTHTIGAYKQELFPLDEKYLPESVVLESELGEAVNDAIAQAVASGEFNGKDGADGKTPIKGTDYYTEADKAEMVSAVIAALPIYNGEVESV